MKKRILFCVMAVFLYSNRINAQQKTPESLTFWYDYTVNPGKEEQFLDLVKTIGAPVRDKLLAEGVINAWGVEVPLLRVPGNSTHTIWYAVENYASVEKVETAMRAQIAKLTEESSKAGVTKKGQTNGAGPTAKLGEAVDMSRTHDFLTRDVEFGINPLVAAPGLLPYIRFNFIKVHPGKGAEYRKTWEKYNKPVLDQLMADGVILVYGLSVEDVRTSGDFTHFTWYVLKDLSSMDKVRAAFNSDRDHRSQEAQDAIVSLFASLTDMDASRSEIDREIIFHVGAMK